MSSSDEPMRSALKAFADDALDGSWSGRREREAVSLFAFGPLLRQVDPEGFIRDSRQIGLEIAIPQVAVGKDSQRRGKNQVCKDVVVWPEPRMTCWDKNGDPTIAPAAVLEWKFGSTRVSRRDVSWLKAFTGEYADCVGYAVTANPPESEFRLSCTRVTATQEQPEWVFVP